MTLNLSTSVPSASPTAPIRLAWRDVKVVTAVRVSSWAVRLASVQSATGVLASCDGLHVRGVYAPRDMAQVVDRQPFGDRADQQLVRRSISVTRAQLPVALDVNVTEPGPAFISAALVNVGPKPNAPVSVVPPADLDDVDVSVLTPPGVVSGAPASGQVLTCAPLERAYSGIEGHDFTVAFDPRNLWPQPRYGTVTAAQKDTAENALRASVCSGAATLDAAQAAFLAKWVR